MRILDVSDTIDVFGVVLIAQPFAGAFCLGASEKMPGLICTDVHDFELYLPAGRG